MDKSIGRSIRDEVLIHHILHKNQYAMWKIQMYKILKSIATKEATRYCRQKRCYCYN